MAIVIGTIGNDVLTGTAASDQIEGLDGNDTLIGLAGDDSMDGGLGDDVFHVEDFGDLVIELAGGGNDRIAAYVSYVLGAGADVETLETITQSDATAINLTGNAFGQLVIGNAGINQLDGGGGDDTLVGLGGNDTLIGGLGSDTLHGGLGNDVYFVDSTGDLVVELAGQGTDRLATAVSYVLGDDMEIETVEALVVAGTDPIDLTGNAFAQRLVGNSGNNRLDGGDGNDRLEAGDGNDVLIGGSGADQMFGGLGNDTYYVDNTSDFVSELGTPTGLSGGIDRIATSVSFQVSNVEFLEAVNLTDTTPLSLRTIGGAAATIIGNNGDNTIDGGGGQDILTGAGGADTFVFRDRPNTSSLVTEITDFTPGSDRIAIENFGFDWNAPEGPMSPTYFGIYGAHDDNDKLVYNPTSGELYWRLDSGTLLEFAHLVGDPVISASDFVVI